ncbi:argininosuccinate lyase [Roseinatronobacter alkalisoli]|uniref:argininosuccinate lyase n=1 Tax=Roseinatronobacter alkalisoli TaxID=3028235 RepID=A0ABT5TD53_9RHOB|nr:argininosuccinate lyase [Roseinatronobacter sp. HJB301]MDD7973046.1 argininosuccinate lyase [Roseinatronobacter sp. HJB301]
MTDTTRFPDPVYARTVLAPLFDHAQAHHAEDFHAIDQAHLLMLDETGILNPADATRIAQALIRVHQAQSGTHKVYDGSVEDYFFHIEASLRADLGADLAGRLHTARSRNDIDHTLFRMRLRYRLDGLLDQTHTLLNALLDAASRHRDTVIVAYTHGQPAQPTTYGHYLCAVIEVVLGDMARLRAARAQVDCSPMGAAAITTSGFAVDRHAVARDLGFAGVQLNSYGAIATVDYITATYSALQLLLLHLGRPVQDMQFWTAFEVGQLYVPNALVQVSSIMPQKRNPVPIEHLRHLASQGAGLAQMMLGIVHNTPFTDMNDSEGETQAAGYRAFDVAGRVLDLMTALVQAVRIDSARVANTMDRACITITELADTLVRQEGLSFRMAHEIAADVARAVVAVRGSLGTDGYVPFQAAFARVTGRDSALGQADFAKAVSAGGFIALRDRPGGPAPAALRSALDEYSMRAQQLLQAQEVDKHRLQSAREGRIARFDALARRR